MFRQTLSTPVLSLFVAVFSLFAADCSKSLDLTGKQCPCVAGYVCDEATNTCVPPHDSGVLDSNVIDTADVDTGPTNPPIGITAGNSHTCVLFEEGTVRCWGKNDKGQLGYGDMQNVGDNEHPADMPVVDLGAKAIQVVAGGTSTCVLLAGGTVRCWGESNFGQGGYGNTETFGDEAGEVPSSLGPVSLGGTATQLAGGQNHFCALMEEGDVVCWGQGIAGQLGYGNTNNVGDAPGDLPSDVGAVSLGGKAIHIAAGQSHTCAVMEDATVRCWGDGYEGKLGYASTANKGDTPGTIPSLNGSVQLGVDVEHISTGWNSTCALYTNGNILCWGSGDYGQTGQGNTDNLGDDEPPNDAGPVSVGGKVIQLEGGAYFNCAILDNGNVRSWGYGIGGCLGYGNEANVGDVASPATYDTLDIGGPAVQLAAGLAHTCVILENSDVRCWGSSFSGQLGYGNTEAIGDGELPSNAGPVLLQ